MAGFPGIQQKFTALLKWKEGGKGEEEKKKSKESQFMIIFIPERDDVQ